MKRLFFEDITPYYYLMSEKEIKDFTKSKIIFALTPLLALIPMLIWNNFSLSIIIPVAMIFGFKFPYFYLQLRHNHHCNEVLNAVPLWLSTVYALVEKNTIHNAIVNSLNDDTPAEIRKDLHEFINKISKNPEDKSAYCDFLKRYSVDGFDEIMLKLFEFRSLDKTRLKEEFDFLNDSLEKINTLKRAERFKRKVNKRDMIVASLLIGTPCIYLLAVSMMPELYSSFM